MGEHGEKEGEFCGGTRLFIRDHILDDGTEPLAASLQHWLSPDIVVVQPNGTAGGEAVAGQVNRVEVTVHNSCGVRATEVFVDVFISDPSTAFTPVSATPVGSGFLTVDGYSSATISIDWIPLPAQAGHRCLAARASLIFPPDTYLNGSIFDVRGDRHVAQRNISIVSLAPAQNQLIFPFVIVNAGLEADIFMVVAEELREPEQLKLLGQSAGTRFGRFGDEPLREIGVRLTEKREVMEAARMPGREYARSADSSGQSIELVLDPGEEQHGVLVVGRNPSTREGDLHAVEVRQYDRKRRIVGGLTVIVEH